MIMRSPHYGSMTICILVTVKRKTPSRTYEKLKLLIKAKGRI
nr:MAG TPA: hypothetical protein [Caudoviricetes sp.]